MAGSRGHSHDLANVFSTVAVFRAIGVASVVSGASGISDITECNSTVSVIANISAFPGSAPNLILVV
jgi:hypothetical protein